MSTRNPENPDQIQPRGGVDADMETSMDRKSTVSRPPPPDFSQPKTAENALIAWDELDEQLLQMLAEDPERGRRLRKLQDVDGWLRARAAEAAVKTGGPALLECPEAEELYDFGQGPGSTTLSQARQDAIDRHLATCRECESFVETLTSAPVPELVLGLPEEDVEVDVPTWTRPTPIHPIKRQGPRRLLVGAGLAAAAAVVAMIAIQSQSAPSLGLPVQVEVRGSQPILYPRGHVLVPSDELKKVFPALGGPVEYQVDPQQDASGYTLYLSRHDASAFAKTEPVDQIDSKEPAGFITRPLPVDHYTLAASFTVQGLPQPLTAREFDVRTDPAIESKLLEIRSQPEPQRTVAAIKILVNDDYWNDARNLARTLPASSERDLFLNQPPGR
jgi:hypothetical protein